MMCDTVRQLHGGATRKAPERDSRRAALVLVDLLKVHSHCFSYEPGSVEQGIRRTVALIYQCRSSCVPVVLVTMARNRELVPEISDAAGPLRITFQKHRMSAFSNPGFDAYLSNEGVDTMIVGGWVRHLCVMATAADALARGYSVMTSDDIMFGVSDILDGRARDSALGYFRMNGCLYEDAQDIMEAVRAPLNGASRQSTKIRANDIRADREIC